MSTGSGHFQSIEHNLNALRGRIPDLPFSELFICRMLVSMNREIAILLDHAIRPHGLGEPEFRVLSTLYAAPDGAAFPTDLCALAQLSPTNLSRTGDALATAAFITRTSSIPDRRRVIFRITDSGSELIQKLSPPILSDLRTLFGDLPEVEQRQLVEQLKRIQLRGMP